MRGIFLFILSQILGLALFPLGILCGVINGFVGHRPGTGMRSADQKFMLLAISFDQYGNVVCAELFNRIFILKSSQSKFGKIEETISLAIGLNLQAGTLSKTGRLLNRIMNFFEKDHALKTVEAYNRTLTNNNSRFF